MSRVDEQPVLWRLLGSHQGFADTHGQLMAWGKLLKPSGPYCFSSVRMEIKHLLHTMPGGPQ